MSEYKVAEGFAFTSGGSIYEAGDSISAEQFGGNEDAFAAAIEKGMIVAVSEGKDAAAGKNNTSADGGAGENKNSSKKTLDVLGKKELEELAAKLKIEAAGKKKEEIVALIKKQIADYLVGIDAETDEQVKAFAVFFGADGKDKTKDEIVSILTELQK